MPSIYYVTLDRDQNRQSVPKIYRVEFWGGYVQSVKTRRRYFTNSRERTSWCTIWDPRYKKRPGGTAKTAIEMVYRAKYERRERHDEITSPPIVQNDALTGERYHPVPIVTKPPADIPYGRSRSDYRAEYLIKIHRSRTSAERYGYTIYVRQWIVLHRTTWDKGVGSWRTIRKIHLDNVGWTPADVRAKAKVAIAELKQDTLAGIVAERMDNVGITKTRPQNPGYPIANLHKK